MILIHHRAGRRARRQRAARTGAAILTLWLGASANAAAALIAYYPFDGSAVDASSNGHHGAASGTSATADRFGNPAGALAFDGSPGGTSDWDRVDVPTGTDLALTGDWTIAGWLSTSGANCSYWQNHTQPTNSCGAYFAQSQLWADNAGIVLEAVEYNGSYALGASVHTAAGWEYLWYGVAPFPAGWFHVAYRFDTTGNDLTLFVDGSPIASKTLSGSATYAGGGTTRFGHMGTIGNIWNPYEGALDEFRIYGAPLGDSAIAALAGSAKAPEPTTLALALAGGLLALARAGRARG